MIRFALGIIFGIVIATVGFSGITKLADTQINKFEHPLKENSN